MKRTVVIAIAGLAVAAAIFLIKCSRDDATTAHKPGTAQRGATTGAASTRIPDTHVDPRTLQRGSLAGTVTDVARAPIPNARVCADASSRVLPRQLTREPLCANTDPQGRYSITSLLAADYVVVATAPTYRPGTHQPATDPRLPAFRLAAGEARTGVDVVLRSGGVEITGTVSDVTGGPIAQALVRGWSGWRSETRTPPVESDAQGRFSMWVDPGYASLSASAEGYADGEANGRVPGTFDIFLTPESSLAGTVVDATTNEPVAGVTVEARSVDYSGGNESDVTDDKGTFRITRLAAGRYRPAARAPHGYGNGDGSTMVGLGQHVDGIVLRLHPGFRVTGKIVLPDKSTCTDASLELEDQGRDRGVETARDPDGTLRADGVLPGTYLVEVSCRDHLSREKYDPITIVDKDLLDLTWEVDAGASVRGRVLLKGQPVEEANVWAVSIGGAARARPSGGGNETKADGSYVIGGMRPGKVKLDVSSTRGNGPADGVEVEVTAGVTVERDLVLEAGGILAGVVVDGDDKPVPGIDVRARPLAGRGGDGARSGPDGTFAIDDLRPGEYRVHASRAGTELRKPGTTDNDKQGVRVAVAVGKTATVRLVVESPSGIIKGTVVDTSGQPAADAYVSAARESEAAGAQNMSVQRTRWGWDEKPVIAGLDGTFTITGLAAGRYTVRAYRKGGGEAIAEHVPVGGTTQLQIRATGSIAGTVRTPSGAPEEVTVELQDPKVGFWRNEHFFRTGGVFSIRDLPGGNFTLTVSSRRGKKQLTVELKEGETKAGIDVALDGFVAITGRVVDTVTNQPVPGMRMSAALGKDGRGGSSGASDPDAAYISGDDGRFTIKEAPTGTITLRGYPKDYRESEYGSIAELRDVTGSGTVDVGDVRALKRRVKQGGIVGELGVKFVEAAAGTALDARELKVAYIDPRGPAAKTELAVGDLVISIDGVDVTGTSNAFAGTLLRAPPGTKLVFGLSRGASVSIILAAP